MTYLRRLELVCGIAASVCGVILLFALILAPLVVTANQPCVDGRLCSASSSHVSLLQSEGVAGLLPPLIICGIVFAGIALGAYLHARHIRSYIGRTLLLMCSALLALFTALALLSGDALLTPCLALALLASALSFAPEGSGQFGGTRSE